MQRALLAVALGATLLAAAPAHAAPGDTNGAGPGAAKQHFRDGTDRYARGDYDGAIEAFKAAIAADPSLPGPYRDLGLAYRAENRCTDALPMYQKYVELKPDGRYSDRVRREIDLCRAKLGQTPLYPSGGPVVHSTGSSGPPEAQSFLHIAADLIGGDVTDEATVRIDGVIRGPTPITVPVVAGVHKVHLDRHGFEAVDATVEVAPGERRDIELTMNKLPDQQQPAVAATTPGENLPTVSYRKYAWALLGVAAAAGAMGAGFGIAESALHADAVSADHATTTRDMIDEKANTGTNYATAAYIGYGVGGAALLASVIIFIVDPSRGISNEHKTYLAPTVGKGGAGMAAHVSF